VALTGSDGALLERVSYTAYGVARHHWRGDVNGDGAVDSADLAIVFGAFGDSIDDAGYRAEADLFPDGTIDAADSAIVLGGWQAALPAGVLSSPLVDNRIGYCGYVFAPETQTYLVRHRWYLPPLGRWGQRDPAGYVDGMNLYEYVRSKPATLADPLGLDAIECPPNLKGRCHCRAVKVAVVSGGADPDFLKDVKGYFETVGKAGYILDLVSGNVLGLAYSLGTADVPAAALDRIERHLRDLGGVDVWIYMGHRCCRCGHWRWLSPPGSVAPLKMPLYDCSDCRYYDEPAPPERSAIRCRPPSRAGTLEFFERFLAEEARQPDVILRCIRQAIDACGDQLDLDLSR
jgi:RHS repeat-associated protein